MNDNYLNNQRLNRQSIIRGWSAAGVKCSPGQRTNNLFLNERLLRTAARKSKDKPEHFLNIIKHV